MIVVSNTTPLIGLASIERFELLHQVLGEVQIAQAVYDEELVLGVRKAVRNVKFPRPVGSRR